MARPEERPVPDDRPADAAAVEAVVGVGQPALLFRLAGLLDEEVLVDAPHRAGLVEARAVELVGPGPRRHVEHAAAGAAHLGVVGVDLDLHFLDRLDGRVQHGAAGQLGDRHAVEQVVVGADAATAERHERGVALILLPVELRVAGGHHRRHVTPIRKALRPGAGRVSSTSRSSVPPVEALEVSMSGAAPVTVTVSCSVPTSSRMSRVRNCWVPMRTPGALVGLEAGQRGLDRVGAGRDGREVVFAGVVGGRLAGDAGRFVDQLHGDAGNHAVGVPHRAAHAAGERLGGRGAARSRPPQAERTKPAAGSSWSPRFDDGPKPDAAARDAQLFPLEPREPVTSGCRPNERLHPRCGTAIPDKTHQTSAATDQPREHGPAGSAAGRSDQRRRDRAPAAGCRARR